MLAGQYINSDVNDINWKSLRLIAWSIRHSTNHDVAKNGCCAAHGSSHRTNVAAKLRQLVLVSEMTVSADSWNLLKCVVHSEFHCMRCKAFLKSTVPNHQKLKKSHSLIFYEVNLLNSVHSALNSGLWLLEASNTQLCCLFLSRGRKRMGKWSIWLIDNWSTRKVLTS